MKFKLIEQALIEDIEAMKKYYPNIPDEEFIKYIELDPTYKGGDNAGNYARWILGLADKNKLDNIGHVKDILTRFDKERNNLVTRDIMKFKSMVELEDFLNDDNSYKELTHRQEVRQRQKDRRDYKNNKTDLGDEAQLVYDDDEWQIWIPLTYSASCKLGAGSTWCTASTESSYYYDRYSKDGNLYIIINKKKPEEEKYQLHLESSSLMDIDDDEVELSWLIKHLSLGAGEYVKDIIRGVVAPVDSNYRISINELSEIICLEDGVTGVDYRDAEYITTSAFYNDLSVEELEQHTELDGWRFIPSYTSYDRATDTYRAIEVTDEEMELLEKVYKKYDNKTLDVGSDAPTSEKLDKLLEDRESRAYEELLYAYDYAWKEKTCQRIVNDIPNDFYDELDGDIFDGSYRDGSHIVFEIKGDAEETILDEIINQFWDDDWYDNFAQEDIIKSHIKTAASNMRVDIDNYSYLREYDEDTFHKVLNKELKDALE